MASLDELSLSSKAFSGTDSRAPNAIVKLSQPSSSLRPASRSFSFDEYLSPRGKVVVVMAALPLMTSVSGPGGEPVVVVTALPPEENVPNLRGEHVP